MLNNIIAMYGKTIEDAISNIEKLIESNNDRKTITIVTSKDGGKTIEKKQIKKRLFKDVYYDELLQVMTIYTYTNDGFIDEKYLNPNYIVNIY